MALLRISEKQLVQACKDYKQFCEAGQIKRPDFWHFCGWIGETDTAISAIIKYGGKGKAPTDGRAADAGIVAEAEKSKGNSGLTLEQEAAKYGEAAEELRRLATYIRGQYSTAPGWSGNCSGKALFNQKQNFDGCALVEKVEQASSGEISVKLVGDFGGVENPFG
jgi:hypothetical protein